MSTGEEPCCRDMAAALSYETGRHFFVEDGELRLLVSNTPLLDGGEAEQENTVRYCPFCGASRQGRCSSARPESVEVGSSIDRMTGDAEIDIDGIHADGRFVPGVLKKGVAMTYCNVRRVRSAALQICAFVNPHTFEVAMVT